MGRLVFAIAILASVLFGQSQPPAPGPTVETQEDKAKSTGKRNPGTSEDKNPDTSSVSSSIDKLTSEIRSWNSSGKNDEKKSESSADWWLKWGNLVSAAVSALAALSTVGLVGFQAYVMHRQREAMDKQSGLMEKSLAETMKAANAAKSSADSLINSERAWIKISPVIHSKDDVPNGFWYDTTNTGKTAARVTGLNLTCEARSPEESLPTVPDYSKTRSHIYRDGYQFLLVPGEKLGRIRMEFPADIRSVDILFGRVTICAYGFLTYMDAFNIEREVRFGFTYLPPIPDQRSSQWYAIPSREYNEQR